MVDFSTVDKWGRFEWVNDDKTIKRYLDRDDITICIHVERTTLGQLLGSGVCVKCAMKQNDVFQSTIIQVLRDAIKQLKENYGYTDQQIINDLGDPSFLGDQEEQVMKLLREYNSNNSNNKKEVRNSK